MRGSTGNLERMPYQFDRLLDRERVSGGPCQKMTEDVHNPAVNWYSFNNRDGLVRRRMRFARM